MSRSLDFLFRFDSQVTTFYLFFFFFLRTTSLQHNDKAYGAEILSDKDQHNYGALSHQTWAFAACAVLS
jgi:hypothetical protein